MSSPRYVVVRSNPFCTHAVRKYPQKIHYFELQLQT